MINVTRVESNLNTWLDGFIKFYDLCDNCKEPMDKSHKSECLERIAIIMDMIIASHRGMPVDFERFVTIVTKLYVITNEIEKYMIDPETIMTALERGNYILLTIECPIHNQCKNAKRAKIALDGDGDGKLIVEIVENGKRRAVHLFQDEVYFMASDASSKMLELFSVDMVCETQQHKR